MTTAEPIPGYALSGRGNLKTSYRRPRPLGARGDAKSMTHGAEPNKPRAQRTSGTSSLISKVTERQPDGGLINEKHVNFIFMATLFPNKHEADKTLELQ